MKILNCVKENNQINILQLFDAKKIVLHII
jgi:hypothetical protein